MIKFTKRKTECSELASMILSKNLKSSERRTEVELIKNHIVHTLFLLLMAEFVWIQVFNWCRMRLQVMRLTIHRKIYTKEMLRLSFGQSSSDLNLVKNVWNWMKDFLEVCYSEKDCTYDQLRQAVKKAWDSITVEQLRKLLESMQQRCQGCNWCRWGAYKLVEWEFEVGRTPCSTPCSSHTGTFLSPDTVVKAQGLGLWIR